MSESGSVEESISVAKHPGPELPQEQTQANTTTKEEEPDDDAS